MIYKTKIDYKYVYMVQRKIQVSSAIKMPLEGKKIYIRQKKLHQYAKSLLNCQTKKKKTKQDKTREVVMLKIYREISK